MQKTSQGGPVPSEIVKYVHDPHATGVFHTRLAVPIGAVRQVWDQLRRGRSEYPESVGRRTLEGGVQAGSSLVTAINATYRDPRTASNPRLRRIGERWLQIVQGPPPKLPKEFFPTAKDQFAFILRRSDPGVISADTPLRGVSDAIHVSEQLTRVERQDSGRQLLVDICSMKSIGNQATLDFLRSFCKPPFKARALWTARESHSSRLCTLPLVGAIDLWAADSETAEWIPDFLTDYVRAAARYFREQEWRTSIVLSAITVETLLAELYEQELRKPAPDIPLGGLLGQFKDAVKGSTGKNPLRPIEPSIDAVNEMRIAAVHRGTRKVSNEEAFNALVGAAKFVFWYFYFR